MKIALIRLSVELASDGGVRAPEAATDEVTPVAADGFGAAYTPGTSLAGGLRAHLGDTADVLMGPAPEADELAASPLRVWGTITAADRPVAERAQTAIDHDRGAAAVNTLRRTQVLPAGTTVGLYLRLDDADRYWERFAAAVVTWRPQIGGGRSGGRGQGTLTAIGYRMLDLSTVDDLMLWLNLDGPAGIDAVLTGALTPAQEPTDTISVEWVVADAVHIGTGDEETGPTPAARDGRGRPVVPGTTWKGVVRGRCEWILAALGGSLCPDRSCGRCGSCQLFGWSARAGGRGPTGARARVEFTDSALLALRRDEPARPLARTHVAVDRVTGGARDSLLFALDSYPDARLTLTIIATTPLAPWMRALLLLALRDIHDGYVGVGAGTTRGYGTLRAQDPSRVTPAPAHLQALSAFAAAQGVQ
jgi:CRISPR/Cas system CSM-associated protein Csm3 (group 7 of RAMP superfamily)